MLEHDWVDCGQQERLTVRLKELIRNYPRGIGIIKEFIQKADDAGARSLHCCPCGLWIHVHSLVRSVGS
jgi:hypothetical protein